MAKVLVTGIYGCIGTWVARRLIEMGHNVVGADLSKDEHRHDFLIKPLPAAKDLMEVRTLDVADAKAVTDLVTEVKPDAVIHLAALQLPICKANPILCADVNVRGVMNFLELARSTRFNFVYASSTAVYGPSSGKPFGEHENLQSLSLYGVFKRTNEEMARIYWNDYGVSSVGLRPWTVYGPGRDVGLTADITHALYHSARNEPYHIRFSGGIGLEHCSEVADAFIVAALQEREGAHVHTLGGPVHDVAECVAVVEELTGRRGLITIDPKPLGIACETSDASFQDEYGPFLYRPIEVGFQETVAIWKQAGMV
jgi:nucleoside-diphosphate-sugar epimerase